mmetsp:Transcript_108655/g.324955  ORF Transcript_108655/g.324955 Transcript_108655/m.324955 type:complete len:396 (+) Transcript_108655:1174-2361(+)
MKLSQAVSGLVVAGHDAIPHAGQELLDVARTEVEGVGKSQRLEHPVLVQLVVQDRVLPGRERVLGRGVLEALPADAEVPHGDGCGVCRHGVGATDHACSDRHHTDVLELGELWRSGNVVTFTRQLLAPGKHVEARHPHVGESRIANVGVARVDLRTDFTHFNPGHQVALVVPELHHEAMVAVVLALGVELCKDDSMGGSIHPRGPPLDGRERRGVDHKFVRHRVEGCRRLQGADVRPVPELSLGVGPDVLQVPRAGQPPPFLLVVGLRLEERQEGDEVDPERSARVEIRHVHPPLLLVQLPELRAAAEDLGRLDRSLRLLLKELLVGAEIVQVRVVKGGSRKQSFHSIDGGLPARPTHDLRQSLYVEGRSSSLNWQHVTCPTTGGRRRCGLRHGS